MNLLFVRVVFLCFVVVCCTYFINHKRWLKTAPLTLNSDLSRSVNSYDVLNKYGSSRNVHSSRLEDIEMKLSSCNQQSGLLDVEINSLQNHFIEKMQQNFISCQNKLKQKIGVYKKLYKNINNEEMPENELLDLENKIGVPA